MARFGVLPTEVPVQRSLDECAPQFAAAVRAALAQLEGGRGERAFETLRTPERQEYLFGFGRSYDDGRGVVTQAETNLKSWHGFGLAVDVVEKDASPWDAPGGFWEDIGSAGEANGLTWGGRWQHADRPHLQWGGCPVSPHDDDRALIASEGMEAVWRKYGAA